MTT
ncbi:hypothetical protein EUTSA_v100176311mg, partial [Eutrema salsugineum]|jgi:2-iminobutanoate/2-iminopropanoate deaminase